MNWQDIPGGLTEDDWPLIYATALYEAPLNSNKALELMQLRQQTSSTGAPYDMKLLKQVLGELGRRQILRQEIGLGFQLREELRMAALLRMAQQNQLRSWLASMRDLLKRLGEYQYWKSYDGNFYAREVLYSVLLGRTDEALLWREKMFSVQNVNTRLPAERFFADEAGVSLFGMLRPQDQGMLLTDLLSKANWSLTECSRAYQYACQHAEQLAQGWPQLMNLLVWQAILRGDTSMIEQLQPRLSPAYQAESLIALHLLRNQLLPAISLIQTYAEVYKSTTGKRKFFVPGILGLFASVALLGRNDTVSLKLLRQQVEEGAKQREAVFYNVMQPLINHLIGGSNLPGLPFAVRQTHDLDAMLEALAAFWQSAPAHPKAEAKLSDMRSQMQQRGYQWVAAELDVLLARQFGLVQQSADWHQAHGWYPLADILPKEEPWKRALHALSQLKPAASATAEAEAEVCRLAWVLEQHYEELRAEPREQKRGARNQWTKGRPVALRRLMAEQGAFPYLSEQDKQIIACIRKQSANYYGGGEFELQMDKALPAMIGHPAVYWSDAPDVRIDVLRGEIALQLKEKQDQISLQLEPAIGQNTLSVWRKETPTRLLVYASTGEIRQIAAILGQGLQVPVIAKQQLIDVIAAIAPHMPVHAEVPGMLQQVATLAADTTLYAHLLPLDEGLRLQILMRPLAAAAWMVPGSGPLALLADQDGKPVQVSRDLAHEKALAEQLITACPSLSASHTAQLEWQWQDPASCLEVLAELKTQESERFQLVWPEGERMRLKGSRSMQNLRMKIARQGEWFVVSGEVALDDGKVIALRELLQMSRSAQGRFLKVGEKDYLALTDNFRQRLEQLALLGEAGARGTIKLNALAATALAEMAEEAGALESDQAWRDQLQRMNHVPETELMPPSTLQAELRDYQLEGFRWLARLAHWGVGACLADDMGLGKTVQTLALLLQRAAGGPALVVAPVSVAANWAAEAARFAPTLRLRMYQQDRQLEDLQAMDLVVVSYGMLQSDAKKFAQPQWHTVVLDEAQVIKNAATKRSQAAMALQADFKMIASGTPVENHLGELWNLFRFINPGLLGSREQFSDRFAMPIERGKREAKMLLKKLIQPFILRRTKAQVLTELPPRTEITLQVELSDEERHLYEAMRQEAVEQIAMAEGAPSGGGALKVLTEITRLRRFCCHPRLVLKQSELAGSKLAVFLDTLSEVLDNHHKVLVFSQFVDHLSLVRDCLEQREISYQYLDGSTPAAERKKRVDAFQSGEGEVFLISLKAGGTGLNLTAADYVIHLDPWWNPAVEDQASDRAYRMGQQRPVTIYRLVTQNTIEDRIIALHAQKRDLADSLLEGGDLTAKMGSQALLQLLKETI